MLRTEDQVDWKKELPKYGVFVFTVKNECTLRLYTNNKRKALAEARKLQKVFLDLDDWMDGETAYIEVAESSGNPDMPFDGSGWSKCFDVRPADDRY